MIKDSKKVEDIDISMRDYVDLRFDIVDHNTKLALEVTDKNTDKALAQLQARLESMNEFRAQLSDQTRTFITRNEHDFVLGKIEELQKSNSALSSDLGALKIQYWILISFGITTLGYFVLHILNIL